MEEEYIDNCAEDEIDILGILVRLWARRRFIIIFTAAAFAIGIFVALFSTRKYTSSCIFVPQSNVSSGSQFSSLASLVGIDLDMTGSDGPLNPRVYPQILSNTDYLVDLMNTPLHFEDYDLPIKLIDWCTDDQYRKFNLISTVGKYTIGLPFLLLDAIRGDSEEPVFMTSGTDGPSVRCFTKDEKSVARMLSEILTMDVNAKEGYLTLTASMSEPFAAAELCQAAFDLLKDYITAFKVDKSRIQLEFVESQYEDAKADYESKQNTYAHFVDSHQGIMTATADVERARLASEAELARTLYSELARNLATVRVKVNEDTIALTAVSPVTVPTKPANSRTMTVILYTFVGGVLACVWVLLSDWWRKRKDQMQQPTEDQRPQ